MKGLSGGRGVVKSKPDEFTVSLALSGGRSGSHLGLYWILKSPGSQSENYVMSRVNSRGVSSVIHIKSVSNHEIQFPRRREKKTTEIQSVSDPQFGRGGCQARSLFSEPIVTELLRLVVSKVNWLSVCCRTAFNLNQKWLVWLTVLLDGEGRGALSAKEWGYIVY